MQAKQLWYTRRGNEIRGPFPAPQISRFILLGRICNTDELSTDQNHWQKVSDVPVLVPQELKMDLNDPEAKKRLKIARMREDERSANDRRDEGKSKKTINERRLSADDERRQQEEEEVIRHREIKTAITEAGTHRKHNYFLRGVMATLMIGSVIAGAWYYQPWQQQTTSDCNALAQPWVNWNNCLMEGVKLVAVDLRGARMRNANLGGADLRGAKLGGADIAYANLVGAKLLGAEFSQTALVGANMRNADLAGADLTGANLAYAILQGADLSNAKFNDADLSDADLQGATMKNTTLTGAKLDQAIWLDGSICARGSVGGCKESK